MAKNKKIENIQNKAIKDMKFTNTPVNGPMSEGTKCESPDKPVKEAPKPDSANQKPKDNK